MRDLEIVTLMPSDDITIVAPDENGEYIAIAFGEWPYIITNGSDFWSYAKYNHPIGYIMIPPVVDEWCRGMVRDRLKGLGLI